MKNIIILLLVCSSFGFGCKKDDNVNDSSSNSKSVKLMRLQHTWYPVSLWVFFTDGRKYQLLQGISKTFTADNYFILPHYVTTAAGFAIENYIAKYQLLADDSTLLFYKPISNSFSADADTAFISTLDEHLLVYYYKTNNFVRAIDSLGR